MLPGYGNLAKPEKGTAMYEMPENVKRELRRIETIIEGKGSK